MIRKLQWELAIPLGLCAVLILACPLSMSAQVRIAREPKTHKLASMKEYKAKLRAHKKRMTKKFKIEKTAGPIGDVVGHIAKAVGVRIQFNKKVDQQRIVKFRGGNRSLSYHLRSIGLRLSGSWRPEVREIEAGSWGGASATFDFLTYPKNWDSDPKGRVFNFVATPNQEFLSEVSYWTANFKAKKESIPIVSCKKHSPEKYLVPDSSPAFDRIEIKGHRWVAFRQTLTLDDLMVGDVIEFGAYKIKVKWPEFELKAPMDYPKELGQLLEVRGRLKNPADSNGGIGLGGGASGRFGRYRKKRDWCGCEAGKCDVGIPPKPEMVKKGSVISAVCPLAKEGHKIVDYKQFDFYLRLPVKETISAKLMPIKR